MTEEQILELAKNFEFDFSIKWRHKGGESRNQMYWECWEDQLIEFAKAMYNKGKDDEAEQYVDENY